VEEPTLPGEPIPSIPPDPSSAPGWDGSPSTCSGTTTTTAFHSTSYWVQHCQRIIQLTISASPLPVPYRLQIGTASYPDGTLSVGTGSGVLLPPQAARVDTLATCGPEYCLRAVVVQTVSSFGSIISSDTTCTSCNGGGSLPELIQNTTITAACWSATPCQAPRLIHVKGKGASAYAESSMGAPAMKPSGTPQAAKPFNLMKRPNP
jgi:hypothetical protein